MKIWQLCDKYLEPYTERKNTEKRSSSKANISDIFEALIKLDSKEMIPTFVALNVDNLPDRQPEELNLISIINRLNVIENKIEVSVIIHKFCK